MIYCVVNFYQHQYDGIRTIRTWSRNLNSQKMYLIELRYGVRKEYRDHTRNYMTIELTNEILKMYSNHQVMTYSSSIYKDYETALSNLLFCENPKRDYTKSGVIDLLSDNYCYLKIPWKNLLSMRRKNKSLIE